MGDLRESWARDCTTRVIDAAASAAPRIAIASVCLVGWATALYASSSQWDVSGKPATPISFACMVVSGAYPCAVVLMGLGRNLARLWGGGGDLHDFLILQRTLDEIYMVSWDLVGIAARSTLAIGLCVHGHTGWSER